MLLINVNVRHAVIIRRLYFHFTICIRNVYFCEIQSLILHRLLTSMLTWKVFVQFKKHNFDNNKSSPWIVKLYFFCCATCCFDCWLMTYFTWLMTLNISFTAEKFNTLMACVVHYLQRWRQQQAWLGLCCPFAINNQMRSKCTRQLDLAQGQI